MLREEQLQDVAQQAEDRAEERILDALLPAPRDSDDDSKESSTRQMFRKKLREGELDDKEIDIDSDTEGSLQLRNSLKLASSGIPPVSVFTFK